MKGALEVIALALAFPIAVSVAGWLYMWLVPPKEAWPLFVPILPIERRKLARGERSRYVVVRPIPDLVGFLAWAAACFAGISPPRFREGGHCR
jgi:hypothetical protein